jgi:uncharacterized membrane protein YbhN (UPF0104 family)
MFKKTVLTLLKTVLPLLLGIYLIWVFFSGMDPRAKELFYKALRDANYFWILLSLLLGFLAYLSRAWRWGFVLDPLGYKTPFWHRYHAIMIGYIVNLTIPRAGEASRSAMLYRSDAVPFSSSFGTIIAERAVDLLMLGLVALMTAMLGWGDFMIIKEQIEEEFGGALSSTQGAFPWKYVFYTVIVLLGSAFAYLFIFNVAFRGKFQRFLSGVLQGVFSIFRCGKPIAYFLHTLLIWASYILMFALPFYSLDQTTEVPFTGIFLGFIAGSLGITFTNGGIGTYPLLVGLVVTFYLQKHYPEDAQAVGNALGMLIWATQTLLMILLGLISLWLLPRNYSKEHDENTAEHQE